MRTILATLLLITPLMGQVKNSCVSCHEEMGGELAQPVKDWRTSIHFKNGISCSDCHGGNPRAEEQEEAMSEKAGFVGAPDEKEVPDFCGKCHKAVKENYKKSAHWNAVLTEGIGPNCVTCHTAHRQQRAKIDLINEDLCGTCHSFERAKRLKDAMREMDSALSKTEKIEEKLFREGIDVEREKKALFDLRNRFHRFTHVLSVEAVEQGKKELHTNLVDIEKDLKKKQELVSDRKKVGTALIIFFILVAFVSWLYSKTLMKDVKSKKT